MSAIRFSGSVRVRLTLLASMSLADPPEYRCFVRDLKSGVTHSVTVRQSAEEGMRLAADDPMAYDSAALAAISFASTHSDEDKTSPSQDVADSIGNATERDDITLAVRLKRPAATPFKRAKRRKVSLPAETDVGVEG